MEIRLMHITIDQKREKVIYILEVDGIAKEYVGTLFPEESTIKGVTIPDEMESILHKIDAKSNSILIPTFGILEGRDIQFPIDLP